MTFSFSRSKFKLILIHVAVWLIYLLVNNILLNLDGSLSKVLQRTVITYSFVAVLFYVNAYYVVDIFFNKKQYWRFACATLLLLFGYALARYAVFYWVFPALNISTYYKEVSLLSSKFSLDSAWIALQYLLFSYGYWFGFNKIRLEREQRIISEKLLAAENERTKAELMFLKAQLNPHFLFNTFNFFYSEAINYSDKLANAILLLTEMMRTVTEVGKEDMIPLKKEIGYIENYIQIQQYRFSNKLCIELEIEGVEHLEYAFIPPLLFISVVENMFKYGDLHDPEHPAAIQYVVGENSLYFYAYNRKKAESALTKKMPVPSGGLGLANIQHQLAIIFGDTHTFTISNEEVDFSVEIVLTNTALAQPTHRMQINPLRE